MPLKRRHLLATALLTLACDLSDVTGPEPYPTRYPSIGIEGAVADTVTVPTPLFYLGGGGTDVDEAMAHWLGAAAGGDVSVLRASGSTGYNAYFRELAPIHSAETFLVDTREKADHLPFAELVDQSEAVFLAGGDQGNYRLFWDGTVLDQVMTGAASAQSRPLGGTSAGAMVWGGLYFDARAGSVTSADVLADPFHPGLNLSQALFGTWPSLIDRIIDTHFSERDREGRLMAFLARAGSAYGGIGIDERTAVTITADGIATVWGTGFAWFYIPDEGPEVLEAGKPLTFRNVRVWKVGPTERFDLNANLPLDRPSGYFATVEAGVFSITADSE